MANTFLIRNAVAHCGEYYRLYDKLPKGKGIDGGKRGNARVKLSVPWYFGQCDSYPTLWFAMLVESINEAQRE